MSGVKIGIGFGQWQYGLPQPERLCEYAETAEAVGLDSIWLSDHTVTRNPSLDITCLFAMIAARTRHVKMGPSVLTLPTRHPVQVAKTYATLDYLSGGRMIMAVGSGGDLRELQACGVPMEHRGARLDEGIEILRKLWTQSHVTHHGRFYDFENVTLEPKPRNGALDIWIGGKSDAILKRTARLGDGWFPALRQVRVASLMPAGRSPAANRVVRQGDPAPLQLSRAALELYASLPLTRFFDSLIPVEEGRANVTEALEASHYQCLP
jgi:probable F420-dependent oxidoreductase